MKSEIFTRVIMSAKFLVFLCMIIAAFLMYRMVGNQGLAAIIMSLAVIFLVLIRLDSLDKRIKALEEKDV